MNKTLITALAFVLAFASPLHAQDWTGVWTPPASSVSAPLPLPAAPPDIEPDIDIELDVDEPELPAAVEPVDVERSPNCECEDCKCVDCKCGELEVVEGALPSWPIVPGIDTRLANIERRLAAVERQSSEANVVRIMEKHLPSLMVKLRLNGKTVTVPVTSEVPKIDFRHEIPVGTNAVRVPGYIGTFDVPAGGTIVSVSPVAGSQTPAVSSTPVSASTYSSPSWQFSSALVSAGSCSSGACGNYAMYSAPLANNGSRVVVYDQQRLAPAVRSMRASTPRQTRSFAARLFAPAASRCYTNSQGQRVCR